MSWEHIMTPDRIADMRRIAENDLEWARLHYGRYKLEEDRNKFLIHQLIGLPIAFIYAVAIRELTDGQQVSFVEDRGGRFCWWNSDEVVFRANITSVKRTYCVVEIIVENSPAERFKIRWNTKDGIDDMFQMAQYIFMVADRTKCYAPSKTRNHTRYGIM